MLGKIIAKLFKKNNIIEKKYVVTESLASVWYYHISEENDPASALCGKRTMRTDLPLKSWGVVSPHIKERYCAECKYLYNKSNS